MMRGSLAELPRMSMDMLNMRDDAERTLRIWLLSAVTKEGGATFYRLAGRFQANGQTWEVLRRYSEFLALRGKLIKFFEEAEDEGDACPGCLNYLFSIKRFEFPKKHVFSSRNPAVVNYRVKALRSFMNLLASWAFSNAPKCPLCGGHAFDLVRNFVIDGAEPVTGSDMDYIRGSITIDAFANNSERPSAFERRHSWIPASGSTMLRAQQEQRGQQQTPKQPKSTTNAGAGRNTISGPKMPDAYDTFNDYLPARPSQRAKTSNTDGPKAGKFSSQPQHGKQTDANKPYQRESFLLYNDGGASDGVSFGSVSTDANTMNHESKLRKHKSEPRNVARQQNDSFVSFSSTNARDDESGFGSPHSNMLSSPNALPGRKKSQQQQSATSKSPADGKFFDSFISDDIVSFSADDDDQRLGSSSPSDEERKSAEDDDEDDDEIDITGLAVAPPPPLKSVKSGENLWQPWELSK